MKQLKAFGAFWYDFIVGDDWLVAAGVVGAIALTALLVDRGVQAWWAMPLCVITLLAGSLWRASRAAGKDARRS